MISLKASLKKIIGRIMKMATWWTTFGALLIPLAIVARIEGKFDSALQFQIGLAIGFICMFFGVIYTHKENAEDKVAKQIFAKLLLSIQESLNEMQESLKEILKEIREGRNERSNSNRRDR